MKQDTSPVLRGNWALLFEAATLLRNLADRRLPTSERTRISSAQIKAMGCIIFSPNARVMVKEIAKELGISPGGASQIIDNLVRTGMVNRCASAEDRRVVFIELSRKGREKIRQHEALFSELHSALIEGVPEEKKTVFYEVLQHMIAAAKAGKGCVNT